MRVGYGHWRVACMWTSRGRSIPQTWFHTEPSHLLRVALVEPGKLGVRTLKVTVASAAWIKGALPPARTPQLPPHAALRHPGPLPCGAVTSESGLFTISSQDLKTSARQVGTELMDLNYTLRLAEGTQRS